MRVIRILSVFFFSFLFLFSGLEGKYSSLEKEDVYRKLQEIMQAHVSHSELTPELSARVLENFLEHVDVSKVYFLREDVERWASPSEALLTKVTQEFRNNEFSEFEGIHRVMVDAIRRRGLLEERVAKAELPSDVDADEFSDMDWCTTEEELYQRLVRLRALREEVISKLGDDVRELSYQRLEKRRLSYEEDYINPDPVERERLLLSNVMKAGAASLDSHTAYFTPGEATQFLINVQQRLFGIGAQLRDDLKGFTVVKLIEGGPAFEGGKLKAKDRIIAVDGEPVVGLEITEAVEFIRGQEGTPVMLTVIRESGEGDAKKEEQLEIEVIRGEVVITESRIESSFEPFGDGGIGYIKLFSFYQDPQDSSAQDVREEIEKLKQEHNVSGIVLDLRYNSGGLLTQAVAVTGLFISKGIVVSIQDSSGQVQHLRDTDSQVAWDGPLVVLTNRASASASEIVAQTLKDYGRAIIVGDETTYGKGSFQTFTLNSQGSGTVNPEGEYKVTRGRYYTVSGQSPQLFGVKADISVPGLLSKAEIGEQFAKFPLENDEIAPHFVDDLEDIPASQRFGVAQLYRFDLQQRLDKYTKYLEKLKANSKARIEQNKSYQAFLEMLDQKDVDGEVDSVVVNDFQLAEAMSIAKDLIFLLREEKSQEKDAA